VTPRECACAGLTCAPCTLGWRDLDLNPGGARGALLAEGVGTAALRPWTAQNGASVAGQAGLLVGAHDRCWCKAHVHWQTSYLPDGHLQEMPTFNQFFSSHVSKE